MSATMRPGRAAHHDHPGREEDGLGDRVGDEQAGEGVEQEQARHLLVQPPAGDLVERAEGLVEQEQLGLRGQRPGDGRPHAHAARHWRRAVVGEPASPTRARSRPGPGVGVAAPAPSQLGPGAPRCRGLCATAAAWGPGTRSRRRSPSVDTVPVVGTSKPARRRSSVDLPHPDGPTRATNSPRRRSRDTSARASVPSPKTMLTWSKRAETAAFLSVASMACIQDGTCSPSVARS